MSVLRVYDPGECDEHGVPLDWEECRECKGWGTPLRDPKDSDPPGLLVASDDPPCPQCDGHGSLKAAALARLAPIVPHSDCANCGHPEVAHYIDPPDCDWCPPGKQGNGGAYTPARSSLHRCEDCSHPMSEGTWEGPAAEFLLDPEHDFGAERASEEWLAVERDENKIRYNVTHYSRCDELCTHGGPVRFTSPSGMTAEREITAGSLAQVLPEDGLFEASWRPVDVRTLGWAHDLRPEKLAVLCLRCLAERTR